ncbi:EAL domain-containing response regulator [Pseudomonas sp. N040]|uniref:EAL domain-containing response regulator n=1 Tax=Pseudomonas sp. N040 TaxID=2785325 RepID=UPI0018A2C8BF|nr:EAL domain-containing protein [Pseudomonas sp. N040]MBF7730980.1 EAL domain-containing protein [Pseudomonas sp. N040]MBW7014623.1 EAL domain-containing protein [Pseudomonas sp. N040]
MPIEKKTIRLLILEDSQNEAERLVSLFRNSGRSTRVHRLTSADDLLEVLQQSWDLLIAAPASANLEPGEALATLRRQALDIPFIQLVSGHDFDAITEAMALGASAAVPQDEDELLVLLANHELAGLEHRRARRAAEMALREAEKRCQLLLESSMDAIAYVHEGMHIYANRSYLALFNYEDAEELEGIPMIDLVASEHQLVFRDFMKSYQEHDSASDLLFQGMTANGDTFNGRMSFSPATYDAEPCIQVVIRREAEERDTAAAIEDPITGLFNRHHFIEIMDQALDNAVQTGQAASLAFMRIDRQSTLLASIGIAGMDLLLAELANLLREHFPDSVQLACFSDDAFTALLPDQTPEKTETQLRALLKKVETHLFDVNGRTVQITLSIGVAALDKQTTHSQEVIDRAHRCADELKDGNALKLFNPADELKAAASRGDKAAMIQHAMDNNAFSLLFQPIVSLHGDSDEHYEVLLRMLDPQGKEVAPADLIEAVHSGGLSEKIDRWVILNSLKRLAEHRSKGHNTRLFVQLSAASLQDQTLLPWLQVALKSVQVPPDALVIQFSETDAIGYLKQVKDLTTGLAEMHCKVSINQFGRVGNPLNTLQHLRVDYVKVDVSYTQELSNPENLESLKGLLASLHTQGKRTIAPGIQTASSMATLWQTGVNYIQGDFLQGPSTNMNYEFASGNE